MKSAHKNIFQTSDFIVFIGVLFGLMIEIFAPSSFFMVQNIRLGLSLILFFIAIFFILNGKKEFKKFAQRSEPGKETTKLVTTGIFQFSRNPMYLGMILIAPAFSFLLDSVWVFFCQYSDFLPNTGNFNYS